MMTPFRLHHLLDLLDEYDNQKFPLDYAVSQYFRKHRAIGSKDKAVISEAVYALIRWKLLIDHFVVGTPDWEKRYQAFEKLNLEQVLKDTSLPLHIRASFPLPLFTRIAQTFGQDRAFDICIASNTQAPTTIRVNSLKISRQALWERWKNTYQIRLCEHSLDGIVFEQKIQFFTLPEFKEGLFEIQDEGSQLLAQLVKAKPGDQVLDFCAGAGGKTLSFGPLLQNKGQIYLHDIRKHALLEAKKRMKRAGLQNVQFLADDHQHLKKLRKRLDWVLVDAPCSGTGTLRRNPDMKWKYQDEMVERLQGQQRVIFERALSYVRPNGHIIYATCSVLKEENAEQVEHFLKTYPLKLINSPFQSIPQQGKMDGFFGAVFQLN